MKLYSFLFCLVLVLTGCKSTYDITLNTGNKITGVTKPKLDKEKKRYVFEDPKGNVGSVPAMRVRMIEPHKEADSEFYRSTQTRGPR